MIRRFDRATAKAGFFDHVIASQVEHFAIMAHVYSACESRHAADAPKPFVRGVKSIELLNGDGRWYLVQVYWDRERSDNPIQAEYLHDHST